MKYLKLFYLLVYITYSSCSISWAMPADQATLRAMSAQHKTREHLQKSLSEPKITSPLPVRISPTLEGGILEVRVTRSRRYTFSNVKSYRMLSRQLCIFFKDNFLTLLNVDTMLPVEGLEKLPCTDYKMSHFYLAVSTQMSRAPKGVPWPGVRVYNIETGDIIIEIPILDVEKGKLREYTLKGQCMINEYSAFDGQPKYIYSIVDLRTKKTHKPFFVCFEDALRMAKVINNISYISISRRKNPLKVTNTALGKTITFQDVESYKKQGRYLCVFKFSDADIDGDGTATYLTVYNLDTMQPVKGLEVIYCDTYDINKFYLAVFADASTHLAGIDWLGTRVYKLQTGEKLHETELIDSNDRLLQESFLVRHCIVHKQCPSADSEHHPHSIYSIVDLRTGESCKRIIYYKIPAVKTARNISRLPAAFSPELNHATNLAIATGA